MQRIKLSGLDATRCYAAFSIVLFHLVHIANLSVPESMAFIGTHFGYGVPLFYMVSAFGLFLGYHDKLQDLGAWKDYYLRRFFRIAPLFYFMVLFYLPYLWLLYDGHLVPVSKVISSFLFVFNVIPQQVEGFVWASWSIGVEMIFYLFLPLLIISIRTLGAALVFFIVSLYIKAQWNLSFEGVIENAVLTNFKTYFFLAHIHYFAIGILSYFVWRALYFEKSEKKNVGLLITFGAISSLILLIAFLSEVSRVFGFILEGFFQDFAYSLCLALSLGLLIIGVCLQPTSVLVNRISCSLGRISFSVYLWHPVIIVLLMKLTVYSFFYDYFGGLYIPWLLSILITFALLIPVSFLSFNYIEVPGMRAVRRFV